MSGDQHSRLTAVKMELQSSGKKIYRKGRVSLSLYIDSIYGAHRQLKNEVYQFRVQRTKY